MFRVLRFTATTTLADVARAIRRTPAHRIALVFPLGARSRLADIRRMDTIASLCRESRKAATVVGGDDLLRACAVAGGLGAAVTLDDWHSMPAAKPSWRPMPRRSTPVRLTLLPSAAETKTEADPDSEGDGDLEPFALEEDLEGDPPAFVRELLSLYGRDLARGESAEPRRPFIVAPRASTIVFDLDPDDAVRALWEHDEERLTATIRDTSGLDLAALGAQWRIRTRLASADGD